MSVPIISHLHASRRYHDDLAGLLSEGGTTFTDAGIPVQGIEAIDATTVYAAALYTKTPEVRELGALIRLAEKL